MDLQPTTLVDMIYDSSVQTSMSCFFGGVLPSFWIMGTRKNVRRRASDAGNVTLSGSWEMEKFLEILKERRPDDSF